MTIGIGDWSDYLSAEREKDYFRSLYTFLNNRINKALAL